MRLLGHFVEELDLSDLYSTYSKVKENQVSPRQMLKIMLYAYHERNYSSRGIEKACNRDINYMYLLEGRSAPDHATIARFRSIHFSPVAEKYLSLTVNYLMELGEIGGNEIFIDGTKIEANANKYTFVWKKSVTKNQARLLDKIALLVQVSKLMTSKRYGMEKLKKNISAKFLRNFIELRMRKELNLYMVQDIVKHNFKSTLNLWKSILHGFRSILKNFVYLAVAIVIPKPTTMRLSCV